MSAPPDRQAILAALEELAARHLDWRGSLTLDTPLVEALRLDSIRLLTLVVEVENHFRICLDEGAEADLETVGDLVEAIARQLASASEEEPEDAGDR